MFFPWESRRARLTVALLILSIAPSAQAFFPSDWRATAFGGGGATAHETQTRRAYDALAQSYFPSIKSLTSGMIRVRDVINKAQMAVDDNQTSSALHFDGENFNGGQALLVQAKKDVGNAIRSGNADDARKKLGAALHTVQDYYAHTNWLELGNGDIQYGLGKANFNFDFAAFNERTCNACGFGGSRRIATGCHDCTKNTNGFKKLTSGYYFGEDSPPNKQSIPDWKCHHGGATDSKLGAAGGIVAATALKDVNPGINKDSNNCFFSPHHFLHNQAASQATKATTQYIKDVVADEGLTDQQIKLLFGAGTTLAFALDRTSDAARQHALSIAQSRLQTSSEPVQYVITPFGSAPLTIPDFAALKDYVDSEYALDGNSSAQGGGGIGCRGSCLSESISAMDGPGQLFLLSDKPDNASDENAPKAINAALEQNIEISVLHYYEDIGDIINEEEGRSGADSGGGGGGARVGGVGEGYEGYGDRYGGDGVGGCQGGDESDEHSNSCDDDFSSSSNAASTRKRIRLHRRTDSPLGRLYSALTSATGGSYQILSKSQLGPANSPLSRQQLDKPAVSSDTRDTILKVSGTLNATKTFAVPVDSQMASFTVALNGAANMTFNLTKPDGSLFDTTAPEASLTRISTSQYLTVKSPMPGRWTLTIARAARHFASPSSFVFTATVWGMSPLKFSRFALVELRGRPGHQGYYPLRSRTADVGSLASATAYLSGNFSSAVFTLRDAMAQPVGDELRMTQGTGKEGFPPKESFFGEVEVLPEEGRVYVEGVDGEGMPFQRAWNEGLESGD